MEERTQELQGRFRLSLTPLSPRIRTRREEVGGKGKYDSIRLVNESLIENRDFGSSDGSYRIVQSSVNSTRGVKLRTRTRSPDD